MNTPTANPSPRIGFVGLGVMGRPMALNLLRAGFDLTVHSRSRPPVDELVAAGASRSESPKDLASRVDIVITMLPDTPDLDAVFSGPQGLLAGLRPGSLMIDMSTVDPSIAREIHRTLSPDGIGFVDAPVSGGETGAIQGTLSIMVGGSETDVARAWPILEVLGKTIVHIGSAGAGQITKAVNQLIVGVTIEAVAEGLALAQAAEVDAAKVRQALLGGFASSKVLDVHGQRILDGNFQPGFRARLHLKDLRIARQAAETLNVPAPALAVALAGFNRVVDAGHGDLDHSALYLLTRE